MFARDGPVDNLIVAASNAGRAAVSRWGEAAPTATCSPIAAATTLTTVVITADGIGPVLPIRDRFTRRVSGRAAKRPGRTSRQDAAAPGKLAKYGRHRRSRPDVPSRADRGSPTA